MEADHGELVNEETGAAIGVLRQGHQWAVDLDDLAADRFRGSPALLISWSTDVLVLPYPSVWVGSDRH